MTARVGGNLPAWCSKAHREEFVRQYCDVHGLDPDCDRFRRTGDDMDDNFDDDEIESAHYWWCKGHDTGASK